MSTCHVRVGLHCSSQNNARYSVMIEGYMRAGRELTVWGWVGGWGEPRGWGSGECTHTPPYHAMTYLNFSRHPNRHVWMRRLCNAWCFNKRKNYITLIVHCHAMHGIMPKCEIGVYFVIKMNCLSVCVCVCLSACLSVCLSVCVFDCLCVSLPACLYVCLYPICLHA